ncbi:outer membrane lipoprotein carrier protein LolA [Psychromonas ingrahamii 37]|uniref:Outer-membrane lipoprotein carrier protein n=1 Tax=Psychromonas ingrahamii (strain DSM 17664 / CCUG 51855 / 37) TaxID=357804 RepID=LOLA_PSYIN|nr:outer membrane lipoprotein chaperone LolA [Psychromonas ingrahamii]A1SVE1.1 RecName: Full=Outer-membrane lipoprotein carrier protein; Flags: Precursor [Psychromonas ingrahamii 37]ABM03456.1 outer membrane lipoprotein carrier protein LolA [Psychromonas ingrahamii 37]
MKKIVIVISILLTSFLSSAVSAATDSQLLKEKLAKFSFINAEFSQQVSSPEGKILDDSQGMLAISRPGKFRWEVLMPEEELIVSDGQTMWMYSPFIEQVTLLNLSDAIQGTPFILLSGANESQWADYQVNKVNDQFIVKNIAGTVQDRSFIFEFNKSSQVSKFVVIEALGQRSEFKLSHKVLSKPWVEGFFDFSIPAGVEIDDQR